MDIITYALCKKADKEIIDMIHDMEGMTVEIVDEIPTVQEAQYNVMYLVDTNGDGKYEAYIKAKISGVDQIISLGSIIDLSDFYTKSEIDAALAGKQPLLTWDNVPISGSSNAISSGAIYTALDKIKIEEISDIEYAALATKDHDKVYFVYETEEDNRTIVVKNSNGDFVYSAAIYGVAAAGTPGTNSYATDSDAPTTPPTKVAPQTYGTNLMFSYTTTEKTVYFNRVGNYAPNAGGRATDSDASNCYFTISGTNQYYIVTAFDTIPGPFVALSTGDYVEFGVTPKSNGFKRIYKGDKLYVTNELPDITPHTELTQAQYDALQNPDAGTEYFITDASSGVAVSALESRLAALEMQETVYYVNGVQRVPLYSQNIIQVVKVNDNTIDWYFLEPTSQKTYKARVTAQGEGNTRTNPLIVVTEVTE